MSSDSDTRTSGALPRLPDLVLCSVFEAVCAENRAATAASAFHEAAEAGAWRRKLAVAAVCRRWRRLGLPIVHRDSVVQCRYVSAGARRMSTAGEVATEPVLPAPASNDAGGQPGAMRVKTSLDIIPRTGQREESWVCFPQRLRIRLACPDIPAHALAAAVGAIRGRRAGVGRVTRVELGFALDPYGHLIWRAVPVGVAQAGALGREFALLLPAATDFVWHPPYGNQVPVVFANEAIRAGYAGRLRRLVAPAGALAGVPAITGDLAHAVITFVPKQPKRLPHTRAAALVTLRLDEIDEEFPWDAFAATSKEEEEEEETPALLDFASLRRLALRCAVTETENDAGDDVWQAPALRFSPRFRLAAPRLEFLRIQLCAHLLSLVSAIQGVATIGVLEIEARGASVRLTQFRLDLARHQLAGYARTGDPQDEEDTELVDWYRYFNDLLATPGIARDYRASVGLGSEFVDIDRIAWPCVTSLQICCPMSYADLKRMVDGMPALTELSVANMMVRQEPGEAAADDA
ncbi:hypothetical protein LPJ72_002981 [Coemansia sp. Benny D160-2]|nr:hypothetical protein LPJ72_002981 [Coemansia sp. Benny D160-2]